MVSTAGRETTLRLYYFFHRPGITETLRQIDLDYCFISASGREFSVYLFISSLDLQKVRVP